VPRASNFIDKPPQAHPSSVAVGVPAICARLGGRPSSEHKGYPRNSANEVHCERKRTAAHPHKVVSDGRFDPRSLEDQAELPHLLLRGASVDHYVQWILHSPHGRARIESSDPNSVYDRRMDDRKLRWSDANLKSGEMRVPIEPLPDEDWGMAFGSSLRMMERETRGQQYEGWHVDESGLILTGFEPASTKQTADFFDVVVVQANRELARHLGARVSMGRRVWGIKIGADGVGGCR